MDNNLLNEAIRDIKANRKQEAQMLLLQLLREDPHQEAAWLWLVETMPDAPNRVRALEECLKYFPESQAARRGLEILRGQMRASNPMTGGEPTKTPSQVVETRSEEPLKTVAAQPAQSASAPVRESEKMSQRKGESNAPMPAHTPPEVGKSHRKSILPIVGIVGGVSLAVICGLAVLLLVVIPMLGKQKAQIQQPQAQTATEVVRVDEQDQGEIYSRQVNDAILTCFQKYVTRDGEEYVSPTGVRFKNLAPYRIGPSDELSEADRANGIVWKGWTKLEFLVKEKDKWEPGYFYWGEYQVYQDGRIGSKKMGSSQDTLTCDQLSNGESIGYGFREVLAEPTKTPPIFTVIPWGASRRDAVNQPGWQEYTIPITIRSDNTEPAFGPKFNAIGSAKVSTTGGESYDADVAHIRTSGNHQELLSGLDLNDVLLPPGAALKGYSLNASPYNDPTPFVVTFIIPGKLQPEILTIHPQNQIQLAPLALQSLPETDDLAGKYLAGISDGQSLPYTDPETDVVRMTLSDAQISVLPVTIQEGKRQGEETAPFIRLNVDVTNQDKTKNQKFTPQFYVIDSNGILYLKWSDICSSTDRDGKLIDRIGPAITQQGTACISLRGIDDTALKNGEFVLAVQRKNESLQWFKFRLPAP